MYKPTNRENKRKHKKAKYWCWHCDHCLVGDNEKCHYCGKKNIRKCNRKNEQW